MTTPYVVQMTHQERKERRTLITKAVKDGASLAEASKSFGVSVETVFKACAENGVAPPTIRRVNPFVVLNHLQSSSRSWREIAEGLRTTVQEIKNLADLAAEAGYAFPVRGE